MIKNALFLIVLSIFTSCSKKFYTTTLVGLDAIEETPIPIVIKNDLANNVTAIIEKEQILLVYNKDFSDSVEVEIEENKCIFMYWKYTLSAEEIIKNRNKTIILDFLTTPIYEPIGIYNFEKNTLLDSSMKSDIDMVYNTTGDIENYGVEIMIFSPNIEAIKSYIILEDIRKYIQQKNFKNKHIEQRYIDLSKLPKEKPYILIRPFLVCDEEE
ncbi:hypothetical protein [Bernardetia sp.]|uniref:hypothetical protein n=1 Tax=Bernardetia sp. TaxID=1937974 RepID=UPI0025BA2217|nr:hypothetical protein [Bernardetia sp.]